MNLKEARIALLAEDMFEDMELMYPLYRMREAGADVKVIGMPGVEYYTGKHGVPVSVDVAAADVSASDFDAVIIPGGYAPDRMRRHPEMLDIVRGVFEQGGVVAMICHAGWVPISAGIVGGKNVTSTSAIKDDLINAGATWADQAVIKDGNLISSRGPSDLPIFCKTIIATLEAQE
ncbi:MAG: type 1 glutamine amidotransferase domain-containing protein [Anaerolineae bacterium]